MRILHLMAGSNAGGAENFFGRLVIGLQKTAIDQRLVIRPALARERMLKAASVKYTTSPFGGWLDIKTSQKLKQEIGSYDPDIVMSWMNRPTKFVPNLLARDGKKIVHVGSPRGYYAPKYYRKCEHLVVTTKDLAKFYNEGGRPMEQISVIPNFVPDVATERIARRQFNTPENAPLLLALGRLHKNKGFDILLRAMVDLPEHYLWLGGDGPLERELKSIALNFGVAERIRFLGWVDNPAPLFKSADIFICSSRHEPFGNIIIESWLHSLPVIAAASQGPTSLIENYKTGLLVPNQNAADLTEAVIKLTRDPPLMERLAVAGRKRYEGAFMEEQVVAQYLDLFEGLLR